MLLTEVLWGLTLLLGLTGVLRRFVEGDKDLFVLDQRCLDDVLQDSCYGLVSRDRVHVLSAWDKDLRVVVVTEAFLLQYGLGRLVLLCGVR